MNTALSADNNYGFSDAWKPSEKKPGYMVQTVVFGNVTCDVFRPILEPEERARRERQLIRDWARILGPYIK